MLISYRGFSSPIKKIKVDEPTLVDFAPMILAECGVPKDPNMVGCKLF